MRARHDGLLWAGAWVLLVLGELVTSGAPLAACLLGGLLAAGLGLLAGASVGALLELLARAPRSGRVAVALGLGLASAWYVIDELGLLSRLQGGLKRQALLAITGAVGAGLGLSVVLLGYERATRRAAPTSLWWRRGAVVSLLAASAAAIALDALMPGDIYMPVHVALRVAGLSALGMAVACWWQRALPVSREVLALGLIALGVLVAASTPWSKPSAAAVLAGRLPALVLRAARSLSDVDGDGYSALFAHGDCASFRAEVAPGRRDVPGNGVDENCSGNDATARAAPPSLPLPAPSKPVSALVLITIDSLRADHLTVYGSKRDTSPQIARWAERAVRFDRAYTSGSWTSLALPSLFFGSYPRRLSWTRLNETSRGRLLRSDRPLERGEVVQKVFALPLGERRPMLSSLLKGAGLRTAAVVDDGFSGYLDAGLGAFRDFDDYEEVSRLPPGKRGDKSTSDAALRLLPELAKSERFFLWVHYFGPHAPTVRHREVPEFGAGVAAGYDHEIRFMDSQVGRLLDALEALAAERSVAVVLTSDHGEELTRYERHHGLGVGVGNVHIPLLLRLPEATRQVSGSVVSLVDVMPTLLGVAGVPVPDQLDGVDLRRTLAGETESGRLVFAETWRFNRNGERVVDQVAAMAGQGRAVVDVLDQASLAIEGGDGARAAAQLGAYLEETASPVLAE